jgi:UrcA family protein
MTKFLSYFLLAVSAVPAIAAPAAPLTTTVRVADLDMASAAGQRVFDRRLNQAAQAVCGTAWENDVPGQNAVRRCIAEVTVRFAPVRAARIAAASVPVIAVAGR